MPQLSRKNTALRERPREVRPGVAVCLYRSLPTVSSPIAPVSLSLPKMPVPSCGYWVRHPRALSLGRGNPPLIRALVAGVGSGAAARPGALWQNFSPKLIDLQNQLRNSKFPDNRYILLSIGTTYADNGRLEKAESYLKKAALAMKAAKDNSPYPEFFLGVIREKQKRFEEAKRYYETAYAKGRDANPAFSESLKRMQILTDKKRDRQR